MAIQIGSSPVSLGELQGLAERHYGDFVKAVVDVQREVMAIDWRGRDERLGERAFERAREQRDLTIADPRWRGRLREICRAREMLVDAATGGHDTALPWRIWIAPSWPSRWRRGRTADSAR